MMNRYEEFNSDTEVSRKARILRDGCLNTVESVDRAIVIAATIPDTMCAEVQLEPGFGPLGVHLVNSERRMSWIEMSILLGYSYRMLLRLEGEYAKEYPHEFRNGVALARHLYTLPAAQISSLRRRNGGLDIEDCED